MCLVPINISLTKTHDKRCSEATFYIETGCKKKKTHLTTLSLTLLLLHLSTRSWKCNFVNPPSRSKCYHVLMAATHPPAFPVEENHRQSATKKSQDSLINLLIVPQRDKDRYCSCRDGEGLRQRKLQLSYCILLHIAAEKDRRQKKTSNRDGWWQWLRFVFVVTITRFSLWNDKSLL